MSWSARLVTIGGGTGQGRLLKALKERFENIAAVVSITDDGGSTGRLRNELGIPAVGDIRQCLSALAEDRQLAELCEQRFMQGEVAGHPFGNLWLAAYMQQGLGLTEASFRLGEMLGSTGRVLPASEEPCDIVLTGAGEELHGQSAIDRAELGENRQLSLDPKPQLNPEVDRAVEDADIIVIGPGSLYSSVISPLLTPGMAEAITRSSARVIYITNLVTKPGQTDGWSAADFTREVARYCGRLDTVIASETIPPSIVISRGRKGEKAVGMDTAQLKKLAPHIVTANLIGPDEDGDFRHHIFHDFAKIADLLLEQT